MCAVISDLLRGRKTQEAKEIIMSLALVIVANKFLLWFVKLLLGVADELIWFPNTPASGENAWTLASLFEEAPARHFCHCWAAQRSKQHQRWGSKSFSLRFLSAASPSPAFTVILCGTEPAGGGGAGTARYISQVLAPLRGVNCKMKVIAISMTSISYY